MIGTLSATAAAALVSAIWQGTLLVIAAVFLLRLLPAIPAATRSAIWMTVFALVVALHFVPSTHAAAMAAPEIHAAPIWSLVLAGFWVALSLYRAGQLLLSVWNVRRVSRRAVPLPVADQAPQIGRRYQVCTSPDVDRPSVLGFFSPRVLLPVGLAEKLSSAELHQVLLHETEHLRRSDDWTNLAQKLALVVFPLNPALLYIERRLCEERELACDDRVLAAGDVRKSYATCLTHLAEHTLLNRGFSLALGAWHRQSELSRRVHRILAPAERLMNPRSARLAASGLTIALAVTGGVLARTPRLISFAPTAAAPVEQASAFIPATFRSSGAAKPVLTRAIAPANTVNTSRPGSDTWGKARTRARHHVKRSAAPAYLSTTWRSARPASSMTITLTSQVVAPEMPQSRRPQVQPIYAPAVLRVPVAYAAVRTPDGWIIFQL